MANGVEDETKKRINCLKHTLIKLKEYLNASRMFSLTKRVARLDLL
jgi:hypothetical protein